MHIALINVQRIHVRSVVHVCMTYDILYAYYII